MHPRVLSDAGWTTVRAVVKEGVTDGWILAGGTGLALQLGHRYSEDLDFFRHESFDPDHLANVLAGIGDTKVQSRSGDTLHAVVDGLRISFLRADPPLVHPGFAYRGLTVADSRDIAAMKVIAIAGRGSRKDFVDLHFYLRSGGTLSGIFDLLERRFETRLQRVPPAEEPRVFRRRGARADAAHDPERGMGRDPAEHRGRSAAAVLTRACGGRARGACHRRIERGSESLRDMIRAIAEQAAENGWKLEENGRKLEENGRKLEENGRKLEEAGRKLEETGRKLEETGIPIGSLASRFDSLEAAISTRFDDHERRIVRLERKDPAT